jgi:hypothetical protein
MPSDTHDPAPQTADVDDLILGRGVKRGRHRLGSEVMEIFVARLLAQGFAPTIVDAVEIEVGVRVPAWIVRGDVADFGMVFWEVFSPVKKLKLFASEVKNAKGDWDVILRAATRQTIFAAPHLAERYDASRPVGMF